MTEEDDYVKQQESFGILRRQKRVEDYKNSSGYSSIENSDENLSIDEDAEQKEKEKFDSQGSVEGEKAKIEKKMKDSCL